MRHEPKETSRTDGKRRICIADEDYGDGCFDVKVCRNGYQVTVVTMDKEMLLWLKDAISEHLKGEA